MNYSRWIVSVALVATGCKTSPVERLVNSLGGGALPTISGTYVVYDEELKTGGGLGFIPGGQNQIIDLASTDASRPGRQIRYAWNGHDVSSTTTPQHLFAGFELLITPDFTDFNSTTGKDLSFGLYDQLKFSVRGTLAPDTTLRIEGPDDGAGGITPVQFNSGTDFTFTSNWQEITIPIPDLTHFDNVKAFIIVTFQYAQPPRTTAPGGGGIVYLDDIRYEQ